MGKRLNGTRKSSPSVSSTRGGGKSIMGKIKSSANDDIEKMKVSTTDAAGKLVGKSINDNLTSIKDRLLEISKVKSAMGVERYADNVEKAARKAASNLQDLQSTLEHNNSLNAGRRKATYEEGIRRLRNTRIDILEIFGRSYHGSELGELQGYFIKKGKIND